MVEFNRFPRMKFNVVFIISLYLSTIPVNCHWINLHLWYENTLEEEAAISEPIIYSPPPHLLSSNNSTLHHNLMLQDSSALPISNTDSSPLLLSSNKQLNLEGSNLHHSQRLPPCSHFIGLTKAQIDICSLFTDHMRSVIQGAKLGLSECRFQFRYNQWNCSSPPTTGHELQKPPLSSHSLEPSLSSFVFERRSENDTDLGKKSRYERSRASSKHKSDDLRTTIKKTTLRKRHLAESYNSSENKWNTVLKHDSKEVAFAHSVWSAAVAHAVARSCRDGSLSSCNCGKGPRPKDLKTEWRWGGCSDNLEYGYRFAAEFVDSREKENSHVQKKSSKSLVNLHNNEAGRRAVLKKAKVACKCHGVSGSCALVTCWHQVPTFREIGNHLKERYAAATLVKMNRRGRLQVKRSGDKIPTVNDLVYLENSPNYCVHNEELGVDGVTGRICNRNSNGTDSCKSLCCNRGYTTNVIRKSTKCHCKFIWCCQVVCQECKNVQKISACK